MNATSIKKIWAGGMLAFLFCVPLFASAQTPVTDPSVNTPDKTGLTYECDKVVNGKTIYGECTFDDLLLAADKLLTFGRNIALMFSVVIIAIAGFKYMMSEGNPGKIAEANKMFTQVAWGIFFILAAWLIVHLVTNALLTKEAFEAIPSGLQ